MDIRSPFVADLQTSIPMQPGRLLVAQPPPTGHPTPAAHLPVQHFPGNPGLEHKQDAGQDGLIVNP